MRGILTGVVWGGAATLVVLAVASEMTLPDRPLTASEPPVAVVAAAPEPAPVPSPVAAPMDESAAQSAHLVMPAPPMGQPAANVADAPPQPDPAPIPDAPKPLASPDPLMDAADTASANRNTTAENLATVEDPAPSVSALIDIPRGDAVTLDSGPETAEPAPMPEPKPVPVVVPEPLLPEADMAMSASGEAPPTTAPPTIAAPQIVAETPQAVAPDPATPDPVIPAFGAPDPLAPDQFALALPPPLDVDLVPPAIAPAPTVPAAEPAALPLVRPAPNSAGAQTPSAPAGATNSMPAQAPEVAADTSPNNFITGDQASTLPSSSGFDAAVPGVVTRRLPRIDAGAGVAPTDIPDLPPVERYAAAFDNPDQRPVLAIVLLDLGVSEQDRALIANLPFPVTIALDPMNPDAADAARAYRAAGREVVTLATALPAGATASDVTVTFDAHAQSLPESVAVLDLEQGGFQGDRPLATLVAPLVKDQGRGLLTWDQGLNAGDQVARREGMRAGLVFRRIDPEGSDDAAIRRILDRAAFRAGQEGQTIVVGVARADTIAALVTWALEGRGAGLALGPVTAALRQPE